MLTASCKSSAGGCDEPLRNPPGTVHVDNLQNEHQKRKTMFWIMSCRRQVPWSVCPAAPATPGSPGCCCSAPQASLPCYLCRPIGSIRRQKRQGRTLSPPHSQTHVMHRRVGYLLPWVPIPMKWPLLTPLYREQIMNWGNIYSLSDWYNRLDLDRWQDLGESHLKLDSTNSQHNKWRTESFKFPHYPSWNKANIRSRVPYWGTKGVRPGATIPVLAAGPSRCKESNRHMEITRAWWKGL